jgi:tRNA-2-methylthio-N6-dimethylallyladenosine synthase
VDLVFGPQNIHLLNDLLRGGSQAVADEDNPLIADMDLPVVRKPGGRAWVSIMYGCNNFCSYCIVPYTRGRERSRPTENILKEISELGRDGYREVILLGQNVNSYKSDTDFAGLLRKINSVRWIERIRFVTSHPRDLSDGLASAFEELPKVCEHLHLPLQSGSSRILDLMNRGYTFDEYKEIVTKLRKKIKGLSFTTDIITGFPGETEEDHEDTLKALKKLEFDGIFAFKYSPRPGTVATLMDSKVDDAVASRRLTEILDLQDSITLKKNRSYEGTYQEILVEGPSESDSELLTGRTRTNKIVNFRGRDGQTGSFARVRIVEGRRHSLLGSLM